MRTIHKYPLELTDHQYIKILKGYKLLFVGNQNGKLCLWVEGHDIGLVSIQIVIVGTGNPVPKNGRYVGSAIITPHVWHVYQLI